MAYRIWPRTFSAWCGNAFLACMGIGRWDGMSLQSHIWESMRIGITSGWFSKLAPLHVWDACLNCRTIVHRSNICLEMRRSWKWLIRQRSYIFYRNVLMFFCWADHIFSKALECEIRKAQLQKGWNIANDLSKGRVRSWRERSLSSLLSRGWRSRCQAARASIRWISWRASQPGPTAYGPISTGLSDWREFLKLFLPGTKERYSWKLGSLGDWDLNKIFFF